VLPGNAVDCGVAAGHHRRVAEEVTRRVPFAGALNFRDTGGYPVAGGGVTRWRAVYRSDSLHYLTGGDLAAFDALGVRAVYDLRRPAEIARFPGPRDYACLEIPSGDLATWPAASLRTRRDGEEWLAADYLSMLATAGPAFGSLLSRLAGSGQLPAVVHCLSGKDRTGMAIALLLTALGVDRGTVLDDYELTSRCHASRVPEVVEALARRLGIGRPAGEALMSTPRWAMARALRELDQAHGGIRRYLLGPGGMSPQALSALRAGLID
jgi:protein-tyrosine phosphatase